MFEISDAAELHPPHKIFFFPVFSVFLFPILEDIPFLPVRGLLLNEKVINNSSTNWVCSLPWSSFY